MTCSRLRMAVISRFLKDMDHFLNLAVLHYLAEPPDAASQEDPSLFMIELDLYDYHLIIPRTSWADEFFSLNGQKVNNYESCTEKTMLS